MVVKPLGNGRYTGLSTDTKPTPASTAVNAIFEETDTYNQYVNSGTAWVSYTSPPSPFTWIVYKASSTLYKAKSGITGLTPYSGTNFKTDIWDNIHNNPLTRTRIHFLNNSTPYDIPSGSVLDVPATASDYYISGESMHGVRLRPLGNNIALRLTNVRRCVIENIQIYTDLGATYTTDLVRINPSAGGCSDIDMFNVKFRHDDGTSTISQAGRSLVLILGGSNPNLNGFHARDCYIYGGDSAINLTSSSPLGFPWCNEITFTRIHGTHNKHFFLSNLPAITGVDPALHVTNSSANHWVFRDCMWQTTGVEATTTAMFRFATNASHRNWLASGCMMWDPETTTSKYLNVNSSDVRMSVRDCTPIGDVFMGGTSWDSTNAKWISGVHITRQSDMSTKRGMSNIADGGTITHGMQDYVAAGSTANVAPKNVKVQTSVAGEFASVTAISTTTFTVAIKKWTGGTLTAGTTQDIYWEAQAYN